MKISIENTGTMVRVTKDEKDYFVLMFVDFDRFKTYGNYDIVSEDIIIFTDEFYPISYEEVEFYNEISEIIQKYVIEENNPNE